MTLATGMMVLLPLVSIPSNSQIFNLKTFILKRYKSVNVGLRIRVHLDFY